MCTCCFYILQRGITPLQVVLQSSWYYEYDKFVEVVEALIKGGADVNITNEVSNCKH